MKKKGYIIPMEITASRTKITALPGELTIVRIDLFKCILLATFRISLAYSEGCAAVTADVGYQVDLPHLRSV